VNTLKSAALVVVLLVVLYGVFVALSKPEASPLAPTTAQNDGDLDPPFIDFAPSETKHGQSAPMPRSSLPPADLQAETSPADPLTSRTAPRGAYESDLDSSPAASPPTTAPPLDPTADASDRYPHRRSSYEFPPLASPDSAAASPADASPPAGSASEAEPLNPAAANDSSSSAADSSAALTAWSLRRDLQQAEQLVNNRKFRDALALLSPYYAEVQLGSQERAIVAAWLDQLAAKVIYSREHMLAMPHKVRSTESLFDIAGKYGVGWQLLQNINGLSGGDPRVLVPGTELKVVPGPFRAEVNLSGNELTLYVGELYAGRFPITVGNEPPPPGNYKVVDKQEDKTYFALDGRAIPANDPANPYGGRWISLGGEVSIHGSPLSPTTQTLGCISLSPQDARDVFGILTVSSAVTIRR
jgi:lipoprotein-anchoring transpeptidase ErfK/SrfK